MAPGTQVRLGFPVSPDVAKPGLHIWQEPLVISKQLANSSAVVHAVADESAPLRRFPDAQEEQVPLPSVRHVAHPVIEAGEALVLLQRTQPVPEVKVYPAVQVRPAAMVAAVHVAAPVTQAVQAPEARKYPEAQTTHPVEVALTQAAQLALAPQVTQVPGATIKNPEVQDEQAVTLGVVQIEQYAQPGTFGQAVTDAPVVPDVP